VILLPPGAPLKVTDRRKPWVAARVTKPVKGNRLHSALAKALGRAGTRSRKRGTETLEASPPERRSGRILLVEDNLVNQRVAMGMLDKMGFRVHVAGNGIEALRSLSTLPYDLVLMDCQMPEMDGFEATRALRGPHSRALDPKIPVVALTANAMPGDRERCLAAGMDDYLAKPIKPSALRDIVYKYCRPAPDGDAAGTE